MSQENVAAAGVCSATRDVRALARVAIAARLVPAAVDHAANGCDPEVPVLQRQVLGQLRRVALDVETVISRADCDVALQTAIAILASDEERILATVPDHIPADEVVAAADRGPIECEVDPGVSRSDNVVASDQVAMPLLDRDAIPAFDDAVSGDHVVAGRAEDDSGIVANDSIAPHLITVPSHQDSGAVPREDVALDQVLVGVIDVDTRSRVTSDPVVHDPDVV